MPERYRKLAVALLAAPDPVTAVAHELGDQAGRLDALCRRLDHVEVVLNSRSGQRAMAAIQEVATNGRT